MKRNMRGMAVLCAAALMASGLPVYAADSGQTREVPYTGRLTVGGETLVEYGEVSASSQGGVAYDEGTNTLTLTNYQGTASQVSASNMGDGFTIKLEGHNVLNGGVDVDTATIEGPGSLSISLSAKDDVMSGNAIQYSGGLTIRDCTVDIQEDWDQLYSFYGITKRLNVGDGDLLIEDATVTVDSSVSDPQAAGTNIGIDVQEGDLTVRSNSTVDVNLVNGAIIGIGAGLNGKGGIFTVQGSTVTCNVQSSTVVGDGDDWYPNTGYFTEMPDAEKNYFYVGDTQLETQKTFEEAFADKGYRYEGQYHSLLISPEPIADFCNHQWDEGVQTKAPGCETEGEMTYTCTVCGEKKTEAIDALGHDWSEWKVEKEPTCTEKGVQTRTCARCNKTETGEIDALGHQLEEKVTKEPTCTEDGLKEEVCTREGCDYRQGGIVIPATEHSYGEWTTVKEATFSEDGEEQRTCSKCGYVDKRAIPKLSESHTHEFSGEEVVITKPTCTKEGLKYVYCTEPECGVYREVTIPAKGHTPGQWTVTKEATCKEPGVEEQKCTECGVLLGTRETAKLDHTYGEWKVTKEPTCTEEGLESAVCTECGEETVRGIDALGHDFEVWETVTEPTCTEEGQESSICERCGETGTRAIEATGHTYGEWKVTKEPTLTEEGEREAVCQVCGDVKTEKIAKLSAAQPAGPAGNSTGGQDVDGGGSGVPETGDNASIFLCVAAMAAALGGVAVSRRRKASR